MCLSSKGTSSVDVGGDGPTFPRTPPLPTFTLTGRCRRDEKHLLGCDNQQQDLPLKRRDTEECPNMAFARVSCGGQ